MKIKVCGLKHPQNIRDVIESGADILGFIFYPDSPRYFENNAESLSEIDFKQTLKAGVFVNETINKLITKAKSFKLDLLQLHGNETPDYCRELKEQSFNIVKAISIGNSFDFNQLNAYRNSVDYFLFDTKTTAYGGSGQKFDWSILKQYTMEIPVILSGGIGPEDTNLIAELNKQLPLYAIDINSKFEINPGKKDIPKVTKFIKQLKDEIPGR